MRRPVANQENRGFSVSDRYCSKVLQISSGEINSFVQVATVTIRLALALTELFVAFLGKRMKQRERAQKQDAELSS